MYRMAFDTEAFGLFPFHGDHPFIVSTCTDDLLVKIYEADKIDDYTRTAVWSKAAIKEINTKLHAADQVIGHNLKYDALVSERIGILVRAEICRLLGPIAAKKYQDTSTLSHIIFNNEPHGLKELSHKYLNIPAVDEYLLKETITEVHRLRRSFDNAIMKGRKPKAEALDIEYSPHILSRKDSSNDCDYHIARHHPELGHIASKYAGKDALRTMLLWLTYEQSLDTDLADRKEAILSVYNREKLLVFALLRQAGNPIHLRKKALSSLIAQGESALTKLSKEIFALGTKYYPELNNLRSHDQIRTLLFDGLGLPAVKLTASSTEDNPSPSTDKQVLKTLLSAVDKVKKPNKLNKDRLAILQKLIEFAKINTITTYNHNYQNYAINWNSANPYLVFNFNPQGTKFVRGSSSKSNLQNVGGKDKDNKLAEYLEEFTDTTLFSTSLRSSFGPPKGWFWFSIDYSQIELQVFAWACKSQRLKDLLHNSDVHGQVEQDLFGTSGVNRTLAKIASFSLIYGKQPANFDAMTFPGAYKKYTTELFPEAGPFIQETGDYVRKYGYVTTASGYRIHVDRDKPYVGVNAICQGTAGDIIKLAMVVIDAYLRKLSDDVRPILQVHDELVFLTKKPSPLVHERLWAIRHIMERCATHYGIPCKTDLEIIRVSWDKPEKYSFDVPARRIKTLEREVDAAFKLCI